jgi:hypothetical protein
MSKWRNLLHHVTRSLSELLKVIQLPALVIELTFRTTETEHDKETLARIGLEPVRLFALGFLGTKVQLHAPVVIRLILSLRPTEANLFFRCLSCNDGYIPCLQARRRGYNQGRVNIRQFSNRGWRQVVAVFFPVPVEFFHPRLQALPLFIR